MKKKLFAFFTSSIFTIGAVSQNNVFFPNKVRAENISNLENKINNSVLIVPLNSYDDGTFFFDEDNLKSSRNSIHNFLEILLRSKKNLSQLEPQIYKLKCYHAATKIMIEQVDSLAQWVDMGMPNSPTQSEIDAGIAIPCCDFFNWIQPYIFLIDNLDEELLDPTEKDPYPITLSIEYFECDYKKSYNPTSMNTISLPQFESSSPLEIESEQTIKGCELFLVKSQNFKSTLTNRINYIKQTMNLFESSLNRREEFKKTLMKEHSFFQDSINKIKKRLKDRTEIIVNLNDNIKEQEKKLGIINDSLKVIKTLVKNLNNDLTAGYQRIIRHSESINNLSNELLKLYKKCGDVFADGTCEENIRDKLVEVNSQIRITRDKINHTRELIFKKRLELDALRHSKFALKEQRVNIKEVLNENKFLFAQNKSTFFEFRKQINQKITDLNSNFLNEIRIDISKYYEAFNFTNQQKLPENWQENFLLETIILDTRIFNKSDLEIN